MTQLDYVKQIAADVREIKTYIVQKPFPTTTPTPTPTPMPTVSTDLYIPETNASRWVAANPTNPDVALVKKISSQPTAEWLGGWSSNIYDSVKNYTDKAGSKLAVFIAYNIPGRDNGNYSAGGLTSPTEYYSWIGSLGAAIGDRKVIIVLEPDAIALSTNLDAAKKTERLQMISTAIDILKKQPNVKIYLDASMWKTPAEMASLLKSAGIDRADGFSCNVSGFKSTTECETYGKTLSSLIGKPFIIDTSRNGNGEWMTTEPDPWCNPPGRALGNVPDLTKGYLWLKRPGESDGTCRGYPSAGTFVPEIAIELARNAK
jgi:endoglucanase